MVSFWVFLWFAFTLVANTWKKKHLKIQYFLMSVLSEIYLQIGVKNYD